MASTYLSPGVYVEEVEKGTKPIQILGTSVAAFIGFTAEASWKAIDPETGQKVALESRLNKPTLVTNWTQFVDTFGDFVQGAFLPDAVYGYFANGGGPCYVTSLLALKEAENAPQTADANIPGKNKGISFRVAAKNPLSEWQKLVVTIQAAGEEAFDMSAGGQSLTGLTLKKGEKYIGKASFDEITISGIDPSAGLPQDGTYPLTVQPFPLPTIKDFEGDISQRTGLAGLETLDEVRLILCPDLMSGYQGTQEDQTRVKSVQTAMIAHCQKMHYRFAILDTPPALNAQQVRDWVAYLKFDTSYAALYYPWIRIADLSGGTSTTKLIPPSGHMVGIYNRSDSERGVHKVPANEVVQGALDLELNLSRGEQELLNPLGVNCIRAFPARGIRVWGGRTLDHNGAWRYINVRRLFISVESSIDAGLQWVVFEPNDSTLWAKVRRDVTAFLRNVWRSGALFGDTPEQAFYVKCDEELNPLEVRDLGQLIIEVGLAPVKPAEFVIFRITQWAGANAQG